MGKNVMNQKDQIINSLTAWFSLHGKFFSDETSRALMNIVRRDYNLISKSQKTNILKRSVICTSCNKTGINYNAFDRKYIRWGKKILAMRPEPNLMYDQAPVSAKQAFHNIAYFVSNMSNENKIAFLGDDDFHSILLSKLFPDLRVTVFEADLNVVEKISELSKQNNLSIEIVNINFENIISDKYHNQFDMFYCDPPYSKSGIFKFIYNGLLILKKSMLAWGVLAGPFTVLPIDVKKLMQEVQHYLTSNGFIIDELLPYFKNSPSNLGIISGVMKFRKIYQCEIIEPVCGNNMYEHFY